MLDPTETCGSNTSSIKNQLNVRSYIKSTFPDHSWIDVLTKYDLYKNNEELLSVSTDKTFENIVTEYNNLAKCKDEMTNKNASDSSVDNCDNLKTLCDDTDADDNVSNGLINGNTFVHYPVENALHVSVKTTEIRKESDMTTHNIDTLSTLIKSHFSANCIS